MFSAMTWIMSQDYLAAPKKANRHRCICGHEFRYDSTVGGSRTKMLRQQHECSRH
jgi:hypothetical protein